MAAWIEGTVVFAAVGLAVAYFVRRGIVAARGVARREASACAACQSDCPISPLARQAPCPARQTAKS